MHDELRIRLLDADLERLGALADSAAALLADEGGIAPARVTLRARLHRRLQGDQRAVLFAEGETVIGHALWTLMTPGARLEQFRIAPPWRRRGLGRRCLEELVAQHLRRPGPLIVRVLADNHGAIAFWRDNGFLEAGASPTHAAGRCLQILPRPAPDGTSPVMAPPHAP